jgi:hypothetical protein
MQVLFRKDFSLLTSVFKPQKNKFHFKNSTTSISKPSEWSGFFLMTNGKTDLSYA